MPERITDKMIHRLVESMNRDGMDVELDGQYGRFAVCTKGGSRTLSPRGPNRMVYDWLQAYREGWDAHARLVAKLAQEVFNVPAID